IEPRRTARPWPRAQLRCGAALLLSRRVMQVVGTLLDDELRELAMRVRAMFGDEGLDGCVSRAMVEAFGRRSALQILHDLSADERPVQPAEVFRRALSTAFRRRLRPQ